MENDKFDNLVNNTTKINHARLFYWLNFFIAHRPSQIFAVGKIYSLYLNLRCFYGYYVFNGLCMNDTQIIIKSEKHWSRADFNEERELLRNGVDHLIIEEAKEEAQYSPSQYWFGGLMWVMKHFFFRIFYPNNAVLKDIAHSQGAKIQFTRESNASVLKNAGIRQQLFAVFFITFCIFSSAYIGVVGLDWWTPRENYIISVALLPLSVIFSIYMIRNSDSDNSAGNRNEIIADKIIESAQRGGIVVAIVGSSHAKKVRECLSERFDPDYREPVYDTLSLPNIKQNLHSILVFASVWMVIHQVFIRTVSVIWALL